MLEGGERGMCTDVGVRISYASHVSDCRSNILLRGPACERLQYA
jgi:hypothetical protein